MRPISRAHLHVVRTTESVEFLKPVNKWQLLRDLSKAQANFGVSERDLTVLQGLLSFFPKDALSDGADLIVFPSNKAICERLNGMACSTMRRHLAVLVETGLIVRRDSPNGKRYVRKHGDKQAAFGFDLSPLLYRAQEIVNAAETTREREEQTKRLRVVVSLMRRDLAALAEFGKETRPDNGFWGKLHHTAELIAKALRRKLRSEELDRYRAELEALLDQARSIIDGDETEELGTSGVRCEQHHHISNKELIDFEPGFKEAVSTKSELDSTEGGPNEAVEDTGSKLLPKLPLHLVMTGCPSIKTFYPGDIRHWHQLYDAACHVRGAMGITTSAWEEAQRYMGPEQAAVVVLAILERFSDIRSPGGYLRALTMKAAAGEFSCGPMIMALLNHKRAA